MGDIKPLMTFVTLLFLIGFFLTVFIFPFMTYTAPNSSSIVNGLISIIEDGLTFQIPFLSNIFSNVTDITISPVT